MSNKIATFRVNASKVLTGLDESPLMDKGKPITVGTVVSGILANVKVPQFGAMKALVMAQKFYAGGTVSLDEADFASLEKIVDDNDNYIPMARAQVLKHFIECKNLEKEDTGTEVKE